MLECRQDRCTDGCGASAAPVFPGQEILGVTPLRITRGRRFAGESEVSHRDDTRAAIALAGIAIAIAEGVKLFHIADRQPTLFLDPTAQRDFKRAMAIGFEGTEA